MEELCEEHAWASTGVTTVEGTVVRIWVCEHCSAWTREVLETDFEVDWDSTWLARM